ncbi:MAG TPA: hypothetical protein EYH06_01330 [Chromatiales bacterium]|nr:hypothetical protein [Thiotrichales bacterium]HIP67216.1 hypothetical protein [Chromatiales bacterium]
MKPKRTVSKLQQQIALSLPLLCALQSASALGLGELNINSALNEPLSASIPIYLARGEKVSAEEIIAGLANPAAHNRAGLPYANILRDLRFNITRSPGGKLQLNIISQRSLYEPLLNFLIDVSWEKGHLVKEVSVLLDPPNYLAAARPEPGPVIREHLTTPAQAQTTVSRPAPAAKSRKPRRKTRKPIQISGDKYTVSRGDSLSLIAQAARRGTDLSMREYMEAIYAANPDAFMGSMDRLKANVDLVIPNLTEVTAPPVAVTQEPKPAPTPEPTPEPPKQTETVAVEPVEPRLEILPPDPTLQQPTTDTGTDATATAVETTSTAESTKIAEAAVLEMQTQLAELQGENSSLQEALGDTRAELSATHEAMEKLRMEIKALAEMQQKNTLGTTSTKSLAGWLDGLPWILGGLLLALLAVFGLRRKKQPALATAGQYTSPVPREVANMAEAEIDHPDTALPGTKPATAQSLLEDDPTVIGNQTIHGIQTLDEDSPTQIGTSTELTENEIKVESETTAEMDSAQEAEIYLAYHQYSLAEKSINRLLEEDPENTHYRLLKLRLLAETGKMDEMQSLSVELFREFPDRNEETHRKIQAICDKAFTASTPGAETAVTSILSATGETEVMNPLDDPTHPELITSETVLNEDMTDFLSDATFSDTDPALLGPDDLPTNFDQDTISVEDQDQDLTIPEYKQASDDINYIAEDLTEEGLDLPFDLETEILEEEARRIAADKEDRNDKNDKSD